MKKNENLVVILLLVLLPFNLSECDYTSLENIQGNF